ncbi:hypothetical protein [Gracilimonas mengyeensis]|uniref:Uncharacterized protein n=1 Tax=Gracilimonas mengyeensis TaxID=1302730 RepID=A0A521BT85_9BACT|nr:hypothetical protein [Gracilimonas mengyeensis]SMO50353.1 hypothetical protein SAMN06265219_10368 [Gracilimonas mengyeensis]
MDRKKFLQSVGISGMATMAGFKLKGQSQQGPTCGPEIDNRLHQGPFPVEEVPGWGVVMTTSPSPKILKNFGMGLVTYVIDEAGPPAVKGESERTSIEKLAKIPMGQKLYLRLNWKDLQQKPGKLNSSKAWDTAFEMAEKYDKQIAFRVMLSNPEIPGLAMPDFVAEKVPLVKLGTTKEIGLDGKVHYEPRYDHPEFQKAFQEFDSLLAEKYNGHPRIEYMDTYMYGFWGEGHTWPFEGHPFPDSVVAEQTFLKMFEHQQKNWKNVPLTTNTQPDFSRVGNDALLEESLRTHNWLRTDTIFIENQQIAHLSNRAPWIGAAIEVGMSDGTKEGTLVYNGGTHTENEIHHVMDVGPNYYSLWNWQAIVADKVMRYYSQYPDAIDEIARKIGYRVRPSWIWHFNKEGHPGLILGLVNDGLSGVPGALKLILKDEAGQEIASGFVDPGYPFPTGVRQVRMMLPKETDWKGLRLSAELQVKGKLYPVEWACKEKLNSDGSLTLNATPGLG